MSDAIPTTYTEFGRPIGHECLVSVRLPVDVADELMVVTLWLSLQFGHRLPLTLLQRALVLRGVSNASGVLAELHGLAGEDGLDDTRGAPGPDGT